MDKQWAVGVVRHYGLQLGDVIEERAFGQVLRGTVVKFDTTDNNCAYIKENSGKIVKVVAEWCHVIERKK